MSPPAAPFVPPGMAEGVPQNIILGLLAATLVIGLVERRFKDKIPAWLGLLLDVLPVVWMFFFTWSLVHIVSDLIPARKHPPRPPGSSAGFNADAFNSAGLVTLIAALLPRRFRGVGVGVMGVVLSFFGMADMLHMRIFGNVIPFGSHGSIFQLWDVRASIAALFEKRDKWIGAYFVTAVAMLALFRVKPVPKTAPWLAAAGVAYLVPVAVLWRFVAPIKADVTEFLGSKYAKVVLSREDQVWDAGFLEAHIRAISLNVKDKLNDKTLTDADLEEVERYYGDEHERHVTKDRPGFGQFKGKNVLVIQIEAFEEWLIGAKFNGQEITPYLNKLRQKGVFYPHIFNQVAASSTADCEYLFLNSNHPLSDGAVAFRREENHFVTFATTVRDAGYATLSMHGYGHGMWNRAVLHPRYGFTHSLFGEELGTEPKIGWGLDDHVFFDKLIDAAKKEKAPWFIYAITLSSHDPYTYIPYNRRRLRLGPLEGTKVGEYMHSAAFTDDALQGLFGKLEAEGMLKDTVIVMYGDHEGHLTSTPRDRANLASMTNIPKWKTDYIGAGSWFLNRIPLLMLFPGSDKAETARVYGGQIDFAPTILHYLGIEPPRSFMGHALLPDDTGGFVARWDGSFVAPPLIFDAGLDECRFVADGRVVPTQECAATGEKARKEVEMSWLVTNNDLAKTLVAKAKPTVSKPEPTNPATLGHACQEAKDCVGPPGYDAQCLGGLCMTDTHGPCDKPGSTAPCAPGSMCYPMSSDLNVCAADCVMFPCDGRCIDTGACAPKP